MNNENVKQLVNVMEQVPVKDFIRKNLYPTIEMLKDKGHPYFAFEIIAAGIEFLGACMDKQAKKGFFEGGCSKTRFNNAIKQLSSLQKYEGFELYDNLRCGMCHVLLQKTTLNLSSGYGKCSENILYIETFYCDFKSACEELLNDSTNLWGAGIGPDSICWNVSEIYNTTPATAVTNNDNVTME